MNHSFIYVLCCVLCVFVVALQSLLAFYLWQNDYTLNGLLGIALVLFGSGVYTFVNMRK